MYTYSYGSLILPYFYTIAKAIPGSEGQHASLFFSFFNFIRYKAAIESVYKWNFVHWSNMSIIALTDKTRGAKMAPQEIPIKYGGMAPS